MEQSQVWSLLCFFNAARNRQLRIVNSTGLNGLSEHQIPLASSSTLFHEPRWSQWDYLWSRGTSQCGEGGRTGPKVTMEHLTELYKLTTH